MIFKFHKIDKGILQMNIQTILVVFNTGTVKNILYGYMFSSCRTMYFIINAGAGLIYFTLLNMHYIV